MQCRMNLNIKFARKRYQKRNTNFASVKNLCHIGWLLLAFRIQKTIISYSLLPITQPHFFSILTASRYSSSTERDSPFIMSFQGKIPKLGGHFFFFFKNVNHHNFYRLTKVSIFMNSSSSDVIHLTKSLYYR